METWYSVHAGMHEAPKKAGSLHSTSMFGWSRPPTHQMLYGKAIYYCYKRMTTFMLRKYTMASGKAGATPRSSTPVLQEAQYVSSACAGMSIACKTACSVALEGSTEAVDDGILLPLTVNEEFMT
mmetsp:Transcript_70496/g.206275  ORF Transcript_70496/g.206275 Transcript_70496/m.206275 type:complete len:125 (-) Transcript_70496:293-667(-)